MNWFERNYKATAFWILFFSVLSFWMFMRYIPGFNNMWQYYSFELSLPSLILIALLIILWTIGTALGYGWVLFQKRRSPWFVIFFLPILTAIIAGFSYRKFHFSNIDLRVTYLDVPFIMNETSFPAYVAITGISIILLVIIAWLVLFTLTNRRDTDNAGSNLKAVHFIYSSKTKSKYAFSSVTSLIILLFLTCILYQNLGNLTYYSPKELDYEFPQISFTYPAYFLEPVYHRWDIYEGTKYTLRKFVNVDSISRTDSINHDIEIYYEKLGDNETFQDYSDKFINDLFMEYHNTSEYQQTKQTTISIFGIEARQFAVSVQEAYNDKFKFVDFTQVGSHIYVYFEYKGAIWHINYNSQERMSVEPPLCFTRLLESFKFIEK